MDPKNPVTLLIPLLGIALVLATVWLTGGARRVRLDRTLVLRRLAEDLRGFAAGAMTIDAAAAHALIAEAGGTGQAIVFAVGDRVAVRRLERRELRRVAVDDDRLIIDTGEFTHGRFALTLPGKAARWAARLQPGDRTA
jgi:hypothetical protein